MAVVGEERERGLVSRMHEKWGVTGKKKRSILCGQERIGRESICGSSRVPIAVDRERKGRESIVWEAERELGKE